MYWIIVAVLGLIATVSVWLYLEKADRDYRQRRIQLLHQRQARAEQQKRPAETDRQHQYSDNNTRS